MNNFIKTEIISKINGYSKNEDGTFQIQSIILDSKKGLIKNTIKIHKDIPIEQLESLVGKTIKVLQVEEYKKGYKSFYSGKDFKLVKNENDIDIFDVKREIILKIDNLVKVGKNGEDTKIQSLVSNGTRKDLFELKLKNINISKVLTLKNKEVVISGVNIAKIENMGTFYSSTVLPTIKQ